MITYIASLYLCCVLFDTEKPYVRFTSDTNLEPDIVSVVVNEGGIPEAHVGMLRNHHTYKVEIPVIHSLGSLITAHHPQPNIYVRVVEVSATQAIQSLSEDDKKFSNIVTCQVKTIKEGSIAETIILTSEEDASKSKAILVSATVLLTNQGNPLLKTGVHMLSHEHMDESDFTEWPGHGNAA